MIEQLLSRKHVRKILTARRLLSKHLGPTETANAPYRFLKQSVIFVPWGQADGDSLRNVGKPESSRQGSWTLIW